MIDIIGMGGSSRPVFDLKNPTEIDEYLVDWLERWRLEMGGIKGFVLAGHSFGGYVSGLYAVKYPQHVKKLLMISPLGVTRMPPGFDLNVELEKFPPEVRPPKLLIKLLPKMWTYMSSPFDIIRSSGPYMSEAILNFYIKKRFQSLPAHEIVDYKDYMCKTLLRPASTDNALFVCFDHLLFPKHALEEDDRLGKLKIPMSFFYGDRDWMMKAGGINVLERNFYRGEHSHLHIIQNSDHHLYFDNPVGLIESIIKDLSNI